MKDLPSVRKEVPKVDDEVLVSQPTKENDSSQDEDEADPTESEVTEKSSRRIISARYKFSS